MLVIFFLVGEFFLIIIDNDDNDFVSIDVIELEIDFDVENIELLFKNLCYIFYELLLLI